MSLRKCDGGSCPCNRGREYVGRDHIPVGGEVSLRVCDGGACYCDMGRECVMGEDVTVTGAWSV